MQPRTQYVVRVKIRPDPRTLGTNGVNELTCSPESKKIKRFEPSEGRVAVYCCRPSLRSLACKHNSCSHL